MKNTLIIIILLLAVGFGIYLHRSYARIFEGIRQGYLPTITPSDYSVVGVKSTSTKPFVYMAYGDSLTNGAGAENYTQTYPYALAKILAGQHLSVGVYNRGVLGATSADLVKITAEAATTTVPDLVTIMIGVNDVHNLVSDAQFKANVVKSIQNIQKRGKTKIMLIGSPYIGAPTLVREPYRTLFAYRTDAFNTVLKNIAQWYSLEYTSLYDITYTRLSRDGAWYSRDNFHPAGTEYTAWGNLIYADLNY